MREIVVNRWPICAKGVVPAKIRMSCVSVIIPTYNHRDFVLESLESVFAQSYPDYEVIVVNDGSPDDTDAVIKSSPHFGRIRYIVQCNGGQAVARNRGLAESLGEFIVFLDDDDRLLPRALEKLIGLIKSRSDVGVVYGNCHCFPEETVPRDQTSSPDGDVRHEILARNWIVSPGQVLMRRNVLTEVGGFDPSIWGADDWDLYIRLSRVTPFLWHPETVLEYRRHPGGASGQLFRMFVNCRKAFAKNRPLDRDERSAWRQGLSIINTIGASFAIDQSCEMIKTGKIGGAIYRLLRIWTLLPSICLRRSVVRQVCSSLCVYLTKTLRNKDRTVATGGSSGLI